MNTGRNKKERSVGLFCLILTAALLLLSIVSGFGVRLDWWDFLTGLKLLRWAVYGQIAITITSLAGFFLTAARGPRTGMAFFGVAIVINIAAASVPLYLWVSARNVPTISDITTDFQDPPQFEAVLPLRRDALNPVKYGGKEVAEQQRRAYPDIGPLILHLPPADAFEASRSAAEKLGWTIISADAEKGYIEATDTTFWFGFADDIAVRITPQEKGSRIDLRSLSRVGKKDWGTNAKRIRRFLKAVQEG